MYLPPPKDLGLPEKFQEWREGQTHAILDLVDFRNRFFVQIQPTGSGKSLCYITTALLRGGRTLILTSLKGLQDQLMDDFGALGIALVKGKSAYKCPNTKQSCEWAPCNFGTFCIKRKQGGCPYYDAIATAVKSPIVVTNYAFWFHNTKNPLGDFDLLVCDEAHNAVTHLTDSLSLRVTKHALAEYSIQWPEQADDLWRWARATNIRLDEIIKDKVRETSSKIKGVTSETFRSIYRLHQKFRTLEDQDPNQWVLEYFHDHITFDPLWPPEFAEAVLFKRIPTVLLTSATMGASTLSMLGVSPATTTIVEYPSYFPIERRLVYYIPTVRVDHRIDNMGYALWCDRIDQLIAPRLDRKGIVHTVSYERCKRVMNVSAHKRFLWTHSARGLMKELGKFREAMPPAVLCSPSVVTGWDFPYEECEYQIIGKIPFPDARRKVDKVRREKAPDFHCCMAMQSLVQTCGRGMRFPDDQCENFIIDDHFTWFVKKYKRFAPKWWLDAVRFVRTIPEPLEKLKRGVYNVRV